MTKHIFKGLYQLILNHDVILIVSHNWLFNAMQWMMHQTKTKWNLLSLSMDDKTRQTERERVRLTEKDNKDTTSCAYNALPLLLRVIIMLPSCSIHTYQAGEGGTKRSVSDSQHPIIISLYHPYGITPRSNYTCLSQYHKFSQSLPTHILAPDWLITSHVT